MRNKYFQKLLAIYPDEYEICIDNVFGWEYTHNMVDPHLYINTDIGQIEIEPADGCRNPWHYIKNSDYPKEGSLIIASYISEVTNLRIYEIIYYPEAQITDKMDMWMEVPTEDRF